MFVWFDFFQKFTNQLFFNSISPQKLLIDYLLGLIFFKNLLINFFSVSKNLDILTFGIALTVYLCLFADIPSNTGL